MFGRESWQEFARSHSRSVRAEELAERVEELEAECNSRVSRSQLERAKSMMEEGYNAEGALTRVASVNAELHPAQESHHYDFVRFVDADGHYLMGDDGSMGYVWSRVRTGSRMMWQRGNGCAIVLTAHV